MRNYKVHGPFNLTGSDGVYSVTRAHVPEYGAISDKYGCYIFSTVWGAGSTPVYTPWYVGKTERTFNDEIFTPHKIDKLVELKEIRSRVGKLVVFLISPEPRQGRNNPAALDNMETFLIGACYKTNPMLLNRRKLPTSAWNIVGVTDLRGRGKPKVHEQAVRSMVGGR